MATSVIIMQLLGPGTHADPRQGANLLELASVLAGEPWSTRPRSVHPALAAVAQTLRCARRWPTASTKAGGWLASRSLIPGGHWPTARAVWPCGRE